MISNGKNSTSSRQSPVAIVGMSCLFPGAAGLKSYWRLLFGGEDHVRDVPESHWSAADYVDDDPKRADHTYCSRGAFLDPVTFDPTEFGIPPTSLEATDTAQLLGLLAARDALKDAGYDEQREFDRTRASVIVGVTGTLELVIPLGARLGHPVWRKALADAGVDAATADDVVRRISHEYVGWQESSFPGLLGNVVAGRIANRLNLKGTNCVVDAACASSLSAIHMALMELSTHRSDVIVTGGSDTLNDIFMFMCFTRTQALSYSGDARPFDIAADGTVIGEGVGMVVLKRLEDAKRDGDRIYAVIRGLGTSSDGKAQSIYSPLADGQALALRDAYAGSDISPATIDLVEAHGTGTRVGDVVEFEALREVFGSENGAKQWCALGSVKSQIGHTKAAAGAASLIKAALALHHKVLPPTAKVTEPNPKMGVEESPFYLNTAPRPWLAHAEHPRRASLSAFGFGGSNFHAVLEEVSPVKQHVSWNGGVQIGAFCGDSIEQVAARVQETIKLVEERSDEAFWAYVASETRRRFDAEAACRLTVVIERGDDVVQKLTAARDALKAASEGKRLPRGIHFGSGKPEGKVAFLFPGQGGQYVGMGRDAVCTFPEASEAFAAFASAMGGSVLLDRVYPKSVFTDEAREKQQQALTATDIAQPALGAVSAAMLAVLKRFGLSADLFAGHSYGELPALFAAGAIDLPTLAMLSIKRGALMSAAGGNDGGMVAVRAQAKDVAELIAGAGLPVVLANHNAPTQAVVSGPLAALDKFEDACRQRGWAATRLGVSAAFHSPAMDAASKSFSDAVQAAKFAAPGQPVYANSTASTYAADAKGMRGTLGSQLTHPVRFVELIENAYADGARTFIEVGPKAVLRNLVDAILEGKPHASVALDGSGGRRSGLTDLAEALAQLAALGHALKLEEWDPVDVEPRKPRMAISLSGANYRTPHKPLAPAPKEATPKPDMKPMPSAHDQSTHEPVSGSVPGNGKPASVSPAMHPAGQQQTPHAAGHAAPQSVYPQPTQQTAPQTTQQVQHAGDSTVGGDQLAHTFDVVRQGMEAMQRLQEQTASAHVRFLEGQEAAHKSFQMVMQEHQRMLETAMYGQSSVPRQFVAAPQPSVQPPPQSAPQPPVQQAQPAPQAYAAPQPAPQSYAPTAYAGQSAQATAAPTSPATASHGQPGHAAPAVAVAGNGNGSGSHGNGDGRHDQVAAALRSAVSQTTGYPEDALHLDMHLEHDLNIDPIRRLDVVDRLRELDPSVHRPDQDQAAQLSTLRDMLHFVVGGGGPVSNGRNGKDAGATAATATATAATAAAAASAVPAAPAVEAPAEAAGPDADALNQTLLEVVAELTGYPVEMLELEMDMEADLGIDSIKRVEILAAVQAKIPGLESTDSAYLGSLRTLDQIASYLRESAGGGAATSEAPAPVAEAPASAPAPAETLAGAAPAPAVIAVSEPTESAAAQRQETSSAAGKSVPRRVLKINALAATGDGKIKVAPGMKLYVAGEDRELMDALIRRLKADGLSAARLGEGQSAVADAGGLIWVADARDAGGKLWSDGAESRLESAFFATKRVIQSLARAAAGGALFATVARMDGRLGTTGASMDPLTGGLAGLVKTVRHEAAGVNCRVIDVAAQGQDVETLAAGIATELAVAGPTEVGLSPEGRFGVSLENVAAGDGELAIQADDVVVVSGGARGVTAGAVEALARAVPAKVILLGRSAPPSPPPQWLAGIEDEAQVKRQLLSHGFQGRSRPSPAELEAAYRAHLANVEVASTLTRVREVLTAAGSTNPVVEYRQVDVNDAAAVKALIADVAKRFGPVRAIVHGAGVIEDRLIAEKQPEQFRRVVKTKIVGLRNMLDAVDADELRCLALFSSASGRFGRRGQGDYAMANEVLNKIARSWSHEHPKCHTVALNWGPWDGGMVSPALAREFEKEGIGLIDRQAGAEAFVAELRTGREDVEVVLGAGWEDDANGPSGGSASGQNATPAPASGGASNNGEGHQAAGGLSAAFEREVDLETHPVLRSHVLGGRAVMPAALMMEWMGHGALHDHPGLHFHGLNDFRVLKGLGIGEASRTVRVMVGPLTRGEEGYTAPVELHSVDGDVVTLHARADALLVDRLPSPATPKEDLDSLIEFDYPLDPEDIYKHVLFHGPALQPIEAVDGCSERGLVLTSKVGPSPTEWMQSPLRERWLAMPMLVDAALQGGIIWTYDQLEALSLPSATAAFRVFTNRLTVGNLRVAVAVREAAERRMVGDVFFLDASGKAVAVLVGQEWTVDPSLVTAFGRTPLSSAES